MLQKPETGLDFNTCVQLLALPAYFRRILLKGPAISRTPEKLSGAGLYNGRDICPFFNSLTTNPEIIHTL